MIAVVGDFMVDHYLWGKSTRVSPEAPVVVVDVENEEDRLGGAGNVVNNLLSLGSKVLVSTVLGDENDRMFDLFFQHNIDTNGVFLDKTRKTIIKSRVVAGSHQVIRYDKESKEEISQEYVFKILDFLERHIDDISVVLLSDYDKGVLNSDLTQKIIELCNKNEKKLIIDPKNNFDKYKNAFMIKPNKKELSLATGITITDKETLKKAGWLLKDRLNLKYLLVTLSEDGMALFGEKYIEIPTLAQEVYDVTGAGDTVLAALGFSLSQNYSIEDAISFANAAAAVVVAKVGSATTTIDEIVSYEKLLDNSVDYKIIDFDKADLLKVDKKRVVFTNGCFDILHLGHIKYLQKAKSLGDILIVGVNSNSSVKRLKGVDRPINDEFDRAYLLASLEVVDYVVIFQEDTPYELIKKIQPDILVKGGDYKNKEVVGSDIVDKVQLIEFIDDKSTTNIIERIKTC